jgi:hypothetical protein
MTNRWLKLLRPKDGNWTNSVGAAIAAAVSLWGAWILFFKEILIPAVAPVNISLGLDVKKLKPAAETGGEIPVLLSVSAENTSGKTLLLNKSFWVAHAMTIDRTRLYDESAIIGDINKQMKENFDDTLLKGASSRRQRANDAWTVVGFGPLFDLNEIRDKEKVQAQRVILVPEKKEDKENGEKDLEILRVTVRIPSYSKRSRLAREDLIRVLGGITFGSSNAVTVVFCQADRRWGNHTLNWWFDKFQLPQENPTGGFEEPALRRCPYPMSERELERIGAQVFTSVQEIPLRTSESSPEK